MPRSITRRCFFTFCFEIIIQNRAGKLVNNMDSDWIFNESSMGQMRMELEKYHRNDVQQLKCSDSKYYSVLIFDDSISLIFIYRNLILDNYFLRFQFCWISNDQDEFRIINRETAFNNILIRIRNSFEFSD